MRAHHIGFYDSTEHILGKAVHVVIHSYALIDAWHEHFCRRCKSIVIWMDFIWLNENDMYTNMRGFRDTQNGVSIMWTNKHLNKTAW